MMMEMQLVMMHHGTSLRFSFRFIQTIDFTLVHFLLWGLREKLYIHYTFKYMNIHLTTFISNCNTVKMMISYIA